MSYIVVDSETYLRDPKYWQQLGINYGIPLHIGVDPNALNNSNDTAEQTIE
jgi:hypothetical protein